MVRYELPGFYSTKQCQRIKEKLQGRTFMNFDVQYGGVAGNNSILITSNEECDEKELQHMIMFFILNEI